MKMNPLASIGRMTLEFLEMIGRIVLFMLKSLYYVFTPPLYIRCYGRQLLEMGYYSLPVVGLTAAFTGMVLALQIYVGGSRFNAEGAVASIVAIGIARELAPVLAGLMVAGRMGAAIAAEIGTMRVTEQIDALTLQATNPFRFLVAPRIVAGILMLPILVFIADIIGIMGGYLIGTYKLGFSPGGYIQSTFKFLEQIDVISGLVKAAFFGFLIALMGCYHGYYAKGGAQGVGQSTTYAVVSSSILILLSNYFITELFFTR